MLQITARSLKPSGVQVTEALGSLDDSLMSPFTLGMELEDLVFPMMLWVCLFELFLLSSHSLFRMGVFTPCHCVL